MRKRAQDILQTMGSELHSIDALLLPELDPNEVGVDGTLWPREHSIMPREYAEMLKAEGCPLEMVLHRRTVDASLEEQERWIQETFQMAYSNIIPVGGDSSQKQYPGPNPLAFAERVMEYNAQGNTHMFLGGICIPSRGREPRHDKPFEPDSTREPRKMLAKEKAGIAYHTTQILYETEHLEQTWRLYRHFCHQEGREVRRVLLGVAPMASRENCAFLEWLGVIILDDVKKDIFKSQKGMVDRSTDHLIPMLKRFLDWAYETTPNAKFGIYVECIHPKHLQATVDFFGRVRKELQGYESSQPTKNPTGHPQPEAI